MSESTHVPVHGNEYLDIARKFCHRAVTTRYEDLTPSQIAGAKRSILDMFGVILAGSTLGFKSNDIVDYVLDKGGKPESTLIGVGGKYPSTWAAAANGTMGHTLDFDDASENGCHPTCATFPAAFALLEQRGGATGKDLIRCVALANDFSERLGWSSPRTIDMGWLGPETKGLFAAAFAGGLALDLDEEQLMRCLGLALNETCGSAQALQEGGNDVRELYQVYAQKNGVFCAELTKMGINGMMESLEGKFGFFNNFLVGKGFPIDLSVMDVNEDTPFWCDVAAYKPYSSCRQTHPYIDCMRNIMAAHPEVTPENVEKINVQVGGLGQMLCTPDESRKSPVNGNDARFSIPWTVAVTLVHRKPTLGNFSPEGLTDQAVIDAAHLVEWESNEELCGMARNSSGIVTVYLKDGQTFTDRVDDAIGATNNPMSDEEFMDKFRDCCHHSRKPLSEEQIDELASLLDGLENVQSLEQITDIVG